MKPFLNIADAEANYRLSHGDRFEARLAELTPQLGARAIGANLTTVPPGKAAFPFHHHYANEEHFFIVRGAGTLRYGDATHPVKLGDYIVTPVGGPEHAHQLVNTGNEDLVYLALSTQIAPEVCGYPDSGKTGVRAVPYGDPGPDRFLIHDAARATVDYWDGEDGAAVEKLIRR